MTLSSPEQPPKYCPACGASLPAEAHFCGHCGVEQPQASLQAGETKATSPQLSLTGRSDRQSKHAQLNQRGRGGTSATKAPFSKLGASGIISDAKADVFERTDPSARLAQRLLQGFPMTYFTLAGALQSVIFAVLLTSGMMNYSHWKTPTAWILAATMGLVAVLIWNEYLIGSQAYVWIQTVFDVVIHFCLAAGELLMIFAIQDDPQYWFGWAAFFVFSGCCAFLNLYLQAHSRRYKSVNEVALKAVGRWPQIQLIVASLLCLLCIVCWVVARFFNVNPTTGDGVILFSVLAGLAFLGLAFFVIRSWWYWECILKKVAEELAIDSSSSEKYRSGGGRSWGQGDLIAEFLQTPHQALLDGVPLAFIKVVAT
jgi:hypothetical protein